jgi:16S rRNA C967 or C1407 C5-methylase (RsmB/RsmF family)
MVWREATARDELAAQPIAALAQSLGANLEAWLDVVERPLPETLRLTPNRTDVEWTRRILKRFGGEQIRWVTGHEAYTMPFPRGHAEGEAKQVLSLLHTTGRVTRQEAASMLPVEVLPLDRAEIILDLCAAPGSKTTQVAERALESTVVANEPVSGRVNTLVSNRGRVSLDNVIIVQHDGRHFPRIPPPGFDAIIADLPCTGSATMRKNRDVWWDWRPSAGRGMHALQVGIAVRAANLLRPGGHMVLSTCSLDPVENEAVVADLLRRCPWMEVVDFPSTVLPGLSLREGLTTWSLLADDGSTIGGDLEGMDAFRPPEQSLHASLKRTRRLHPEDNDTGGFFLALLHHPLEATPEGVARTLVGCDLDETGYLRDPAPRSRHDVDPAEGPEVEDLVRAHALQRDLAWWRRGKRLAIGPASAVRRLWVPPTPDGKGGRHRGASFHPLRVIHVGLPAFADNRGHWRIRQEGLVAVQRRGQPRAVEVDHNLAVRLLHNEVLEVDDLPPQLSTGSGILSCTTEDGVVHLPVWIQAKVTLMLDDDERRVLLLRMTGSIPMEDEA